MRTGSAPARAPSETLFTAIVYKQLTFVGPTVGIERHRGGHRPVRILVDGEPWESTASTGFVVATQSFGPAPVPGDHIAPLRVEIQARVASGGGAVRDEPRACIGMQS
jgi:hypothetical protein